MKTQRGKRNRRHSRRVVRNVMMFVMTLIISATICLFNDSTKVSAHEDEHHCSYCEEALEASGTYYTSIEVMPGDTLWDIAEEYMSDDYESVYDYIHVLQDINNISTYSLNAGSYILVAY